MSPVRDYVNERVKLGQIRSNLDLKLAFLRGFIQRPDLVGSVIPSSRFLTRRLASAIALTKARTVVELGPGIGNTTRALLDVLPQASRLVAIEINPEFVSLLRPDPDPRLMVHLGSAECVREILALHGILHADAIISGIPFSTMPAALGRRILNAIWTCLAPGGCFVAYQIRGHVAVLGRELMGMPKIETEFLNVPPVRLYNWRKPEIS